MSVITYAPQTVQAAWDNHLVAFGGKDVSGVVCLHDSSVWPRVLYFCTDSSFFCLPRA